MTTTQTDTLGSTVDLDAFLDEHRLFSLDADGLMRLPILIRGRLVMPEAVTAEEARAALGAKDYAEIGLVQIVRQARIDPETLGVDGQDLIFVLPRIDRVDELFATTADDIAQDLAPLQMTEVADYLDRVGAAFAPGEALHDRLRSAVQLTADTPIAYLDAALNGLTLAFDGASVQKAVDREIALGTIAGGRLLDGWVMPVDVDDSPGLTAHLSGVVHDDAPLPNRAALRVRAIPTRQLHITAGNSPMIPIISAVRGLGVKGAITLKMPSGALAAGAALAVALHFAGPEHPLTRHGSIVYWPGGDRRVEDQLFAQGAFDRIIAWGAPTAIESVRARAGTTKTLTFNPRYGASMIGAEALAADTFEETVRRAATDALVWNQKACIASLVQYVEGSPAQVAAFADALAAELGRWDECLPSPMPAETVGRVRQARRSGMRHGRWIANGDRRAPSSAVVVLDDAFDLATHPASRIVAVRPVTRLEDALTTFHPGVSEVGVAPEERRIALRDRICATGVTGVPPLGSADALDAVGLPQDGMRSLSELVSWVTG